MPKYTESDIENGIEFVLAGRSLRYAAEASGVPRQTISNRILGRQTKSQTNESRQKLSSGLEKKVVDWILLQERLGYAPTHAQVRGICSRICRSTGEAEDLGKHWMEGFFKRNPEVKTKLGRRIDYQRLNGATPDTINSFFDILETVSHVPPGNIYNTDKAGIMEGMGINGLVVGSSEVNSKAVYVKGNQSRTWTTFIKCINAAGRALTPLVIFKGASVQQQWFSSEFNKPWFFTTSENGWTSNEIALEWLQRVFIPETSSADNSEMRVLIVDGHGSHTTEDFMYECFRENIYLLFLPAHSSHVLQPLDLGIFSSLKNAYRKRIGLLAAATDSSPVGKLNFMNCYAGAREEGLAAKNIKSGFYATGIWPRNRRKPLNSVQVVVPGRPKTPPAREPTKPDISTPKSGREILSLLAGLGTSPGKRLAIRKVAHAMDMKISELVLKDQRINELEMQIEVLKPRKRRKVAQNPNERFVTIEQIIQTRESLIDRPEIEEVEEEEDEVEVVDVPEPERRSTRIRRSTWKIEDTD